MKKNLLIAFFAITCALSSSKIQAQQDGFIGEVKLFAGNFAPRGWAFCDGQLLPISSNQALFSILGTTYGGDGRTSFALPDLRGRVPVGPRQGPYTPTYRLGDKGSLGGTSNNDNQQNNKNKQHYLSLNYIIATTGVFPSRN